LNELTGEPDEVVAQLFDLWCFLGVAHTGEVSSASFLLVAAGIEAGDLKYFGQEVDFY
jgi:hypothetical protein